MADNLIAKANVGDGTDILATKDIGGVQFPKALLVNSTGTDIDAETPLPVEIQNTAINVQQTNPDNLKITLSKMEFVNSTSNNSTAQLAAAATFTGGWENIFNQPATQVLAVSNQPMTYEVQQAIDAAGTQIVSTSTFTRLSGVAICENVQLNGNFFRVRATNTGAGATTTFTLATTLGALNPLPQALTNTGNLRVAVNENTVASFPVAGIAAHSAAASGNPVQVGGVVATTVSITEVAGDTCRLAMTTGGAVVQKPYSVPEVDWAYAAASGGIVNTTDVAIKAAAGASIRNYLTAISITNSSAVVATEVVVKDGATIIWRGFVGAQTLLNSVVGVVFPTPLRGSANTALNVACITTGAAVYVNAQGYAAP